MAKMNNSIVPNARHELQLGAKTPEEARGKVADAAADSSIAAARAMKSAEGRTGLGEHLDTNTLVKALRDQAQAVSLGDMSQIETMLINQATALQTLFSRLTEVAMNQKYMPQYETQMKLALRAQSQCVRTLEALSTVKNPPVVFAKQANITSGPQQINNGTAPPSHVGEKEIRQSKLLEAQHGNYLDTSKAGAAIETDPQLATLVEVDRAEIGRRKDANLSE